MRDYEHIKAEFYIKYVDRHHCPSDRSLDGHIKEISKKRIFVVKYTTDIIPVVGDIVAYKGINYEILKRIFTVDSEGYMNIVYEVRVYPTERVHSHGSDSWTEEIPLVVDIQEGTKDG